MAEVNPGDAMEGNKLSGSRCGIGIIDSWKE